MSVLETCWVFKNVISMFMYANLYLSHKCMALKQSAWSSKSVFSSIWVSFSVVGIQCVLSK